MFAGPVAQKTLVYFNSIHHQTFDQRTAASFQLLCFLSVSRGRVVSGQIRVGTMMEAHNEFRPYRYDS